MGRSIRIAPAILPHIGVEVEGLDEAVDAIPAPIQGGPDPATDGDGDGEPDAQSGTGEPTQQEASLLERLTVAADSSLERALEKAASRVLGARKHLPTHQQDRMAAMSKLDCLSVPTASEYASVNIAPERLLDGAWDQYSQRARTWIRDHLTDRGVGTYQADDMAAGIANELAMNLDRLALSAFERPLQPGANSMRVPHALVQDSLSVLGVVVE